MRAIEQRVPPLQEGKEFRGGVIRNRTLQERPGPPPAMYPQSKVSSADSDRQNGSATPVPRKS
jgi:hypothetical protein